MREFVRTGTFLALLLAHPGLIPRCAPAMAQSSSSATGTSANASPSKTYTIRAGSFPLEITRELDTAKLVVGEEVPALLEKTLLRGGKVWIHAETKVVGHVTKVKASSKEDSESRLQIVFDKIVLKKGEEIIFQSPAMVEAIAPDKRLLPDPNRKGGDPWSPRLTGSGAISTTNKGVRMYDVDPRSFEPAVLGNNDLTLGLILTADAKGVLYLEDLKLEPEPSGPVLVSREKNIKLAYGTQVFVKITPQ